MDMLTLHTKSQASLEFMAILGISLVVFGVFFYTILEQKNIVEGYNSFLEIKKIAKEASNAINIASLEGDGYSIKLSIPYYANNADYNLTIQNGSLKSEQGENSYDASLFVENITGLLKKGENIIKNVRGEIKIE